MDGDDFSRLGAAPGSPAEAILRELASLLTELAQHRLLFAKLVKAAQRELAEDKDKQSATILDCRRKLAAGALQRTVGFLESPVVVAWCPDILSLKPHAPLRELLDELAHLESGNDPKLLAKPEGKQKGTSPVDVRFRARAAVAAEMLVRSSLPVRKACKKVAEFLTKHGYTKAYAEGEITFETVQVWRRDALNAKAKTELRGFCIMFLEAAESAHAQGVSYTDLAERELDILAQDQPNGPVQYLPPVKE